MSARYPRNNTHARLMCKAAEKKAKQEYLVGKPRIKNIAEFKDLGEIPRFKKLLAKLTSLFEDMAYQKKTEALFEKIKNFDLAQDAVIHSDFVKPLSDKECHDENFKEDRAYVAVNGCRVIHAMITNGSKNGGDFATILVAMYETPRHALEAVDVNKCADGLVYFGVLNGRLYAHLRKLMVATIKCNYLRHSVYEHEKINLGECADMISTLDDILDSIAENQDVSESMCKNIDTLFKRFGLES
jgi:hypothetical protein